MMTIIDKLERLKEIVTLDRLKTDKEDLICPIYETIYMKNMNAAEMLNKIEELVAFSSFDFSKNEIYAQIYGIVFGWSAESIEEMKNNGISLKYNNYDEDEEDYYEVPPTLCPKCGKEHNEYFKCPRPNSPISYGKQYRKKTKANFILKINGIEIKASSFKIRPQFNTIYYLRGDKWEDTDFNDSNIESLWLTQNGKIIFSYKKNGW